MKPGCAILILVVVVIAAAIAFGFGASNHQEPKEQKKSEEEQMEALQKDPLTQAIGDATGWLAPAIDLEQVKVGGLPVTEATITIPKKGSVEIQVIPDKDGSQSRRLRLILIDPKPPAKSAIPLPIVVQLEYESDGPLPKGMTTDQLPEKSETALPNPKPGTGKLDEYVLPIFAGGATITCTNQLDQKCVIELR